jgi:hypothetical protein
MSTYTIEDLRDILFATIEKVGSGDMDLDRAKHIAELGQVMVNSGKVEVDFLRTTGSSADSKFFGSAERTQAQALEHKP